jgi:hypothetical protein
MKVVLFLGMLIGILVCTLVYMSTRYSGGNMTSPHTKTLEKNSYDAIKTLCHNQVEYIIANGNGTTLIPAIDQNGKPVACNY